MSFNQCGSTLNGMGAISVSGYLASYGQEGNASFTAPSGTKIEHMTLWRSMYDYGTGSGTSSYRNMAGVFADGAVAGEIFDGTSDIVHGQVGSGDTTNNGVVDSNKVDVSLTSFLPQTFTYQINCAWSQGCTTGGHDPYSPSGPDTVLKIYGAIATVRDNTPPTLSLANSGLLGTGTQRGTVPLTLTASAIPGISRLEIYAGSAATASIVLDFTQTTNCQFWEAVPCQGLTNYEWPVDTTRLPDGSYYVTVKAYDPAGNVVSQASPAKVTVDNAPPPSLAAGSAPSISGTPIVGDTLAAAAGSWNGANISYGYQWQRCDTVGANCASIAGATDSTYTPGASEVGRTLRVLVTATNPEGASTAASATTGPVSAAPPPSGAPNQNQSGASARGLPNGVGASDHALIARYLAARAVTVAFGRTFTLRGKLTDPGGAPITRATLDVLAQVLTPGATFVRIGQVITGADGGYSFLVPAGPSRLIRVAYRSYAGDIDYATVSDLTENVPAAAILAIGPRRVRNHQQITFRGRLLGAVPTGGEVVEIQVLIGRAWQDLEAARTNGRGMFKASYRFRDTHISVTYLFRAATRPDASYSFAPGVSNTAAVHVN